MRVHNRFFGVRDLLYLNNWGLPRRLGFRICNWQIKIGARDSGLKVFTGCGMRDAQNNHYGFRD